MWLKSNTAVASHSWSLILALDKLFNWSLYRRRTVDAPPTLESPGPCCLVVGGRRRTWLCPSLLGLACLGLNSDLHAASSRTPGASLSNKCLYVGHLGGVSFKAWAHHSPTGRWRFTGKGLFQSGKVSENNIFNRVTNPVHIIHN